MSSTILWPPPWVARASSRAWNKRAVDRAGLEDHVGHDVVELVSEMVAKFEPVSSGGVLNSTGGRNVSVIFGEPLETQLAAHAREQRILGAVDADRQDLGARHIGDGAGALIDFHERAGDGQPPFREDDDLVALLELLDQGRAAPSDWRDRWAAI